MINLDPIPLELLGDSIEVSPIDKDSTKKSSWNDDDSQTNPAGYTIDHVRVEPATAVSVQSVGGNTSTEVVTGSYNLFVDSVNSSPLDKLPGINDPVTVGSTGQQLTVKSFDPIYDFGTHIHHWEGVLQ